MFSLVLVQLKPQQMPKTEACLCLRFTRMEGAKFHLSYRKFQRCLEQSLSREEEEYEAAQEERKGLKTQKQATKT